MSIYLRYDHFADISKLVRPPSYMISQGKYIQIKGKETGTHLVIFGSVHGNEPCGTFAIRKMIDEGLKIKRGTLTLVPVANQRAHEMGKRYIDEDLNRCFKYHFPPTTHEQKVANYLTDLIDKGGVFLDVHSTSSHGETAVFVDFPTDENEAFARALGTKWGIYGWPRVYDENPNFESYDTTRYAYEHGRTGVLVECGQNEDPDSVLRAEIYIWRALKHFGLVDDIPAHIPTELPVASKVTMTHLFAKENAGDEFTRVWRNLETVPAGTVIATRENGEDISFPEDRVILLPKASALPGGEWFYIGVK